MRINFDELEAKAAEHEKAMAEVSYRNQIVSSSGPAWKTLNCVQEAAAALAYQEAARTGDVGE